MESVENLIEGLGSSNANRVEQAWTSICALGTTTIPYLIRALTHSNPQVVTQVVCLLGALGPSAKSAVPVLVDAATSDDLSIRAATIAALGRVAQVPARTIPVLLRALSDEHHLVRQYAAASLAMFDSADLHMGGVVPTLIEALQDDDEFVREFSSSALNKLNQLPPDVLSRLAELSTRADPVVRRNLRKFLVSRDAPPQLSHVLIA